MPWPWVERDLQAISKDMHLYMHAPRNATTLSRLDHVEEMKAMRLSLPTTDSSAGPQLWRERVLLP